MFVRNAVLQQLPLSGSDSFKENAHFTASFFHDRRFSRSCYFLHAIPISNVTETCAFVKSTHLQFHTKALRPTRLIIVPEIYPLTLPFRVRAINGSRAVCDITPVLLTLAVSCQVEMS